MHRILIVDDDEPIRDVLEQVLRWEGYDVLTAADGQAAWTIAARERPEAVLMDMRMPLVDGPTAICLLRADAATHAVPIIAMSASPPKMMACSSGAGPDAVIAKPFDIDELLAAIRAVLAPPESGA